MALEQSLVDLAALQMDLAELAALPDELTSDMLNAQADVIVEGQQKTAREMGVYDTGQMAASIKKGGVKTAKSGSKSLYVSPSGSRKRNGTTTSNAEIAFVNEYGKRGQYPRPFIRTANEKYADDAVNAAYRVYDQYLKSKNL